MAKKEKQYTFNLMSKKSRKELLALKGRDENTIYAFILIFGAALVYFFLTLMDIGLVQSRIKSINDSITEAEGNIAGLSTVQALNGELFVKSTLLTPILDQDINLNQFLGISEDFLDTNDVLSYSRESTGLFVFTVLVDNDRDLVNIFERADENDFVNSIRVREIRFDDAITQRYIATIEIDLNFEAI